MINLVAVTIANSFDDSTRTEIVAYHAEDTNCHNYLTEMIDAFVELETFNDERIIRIFPVRVLDISADETCSEKIKSILATR